MHARTHARTYTYTYTYIRTYIYTLGDAAIDLQMQTAPTELFPWERLRSNAAPLIDAGLLHPTTRACPPCVYLTVIYPILH